MVPVWEMCSKGLEFEVASSSYQDHLGLEYVRMAWDLLPGIVRL